ncbi:MAG: hypothetical protein ACP5FY_03945 [Kosmotogaceae bacterium]
MKRMTYILFISVAITVLLASCIGHFPRFDQSGRYILQRLPDGAELFVREGIDAIEITLVGEGLEIEDLSPLQGVLIIARSNYPDLTVAISGFRNVDFSRPVLRIFSEYATGIAISKCDAIVLNEASRSYSRQNSVDPELIGDYNGDGYITLSDFASFAPSYGFSEGSQKYDEKFDVGASEKQYSGIWQKIFSVPGAPDGSITLADFAVFANNYGFANPYLGTWKFTGEINYESSSFGQVDATGEGTATIQSSNFNLVGNVTMSFEADYEDESGNPLHSEMTTMINDVRFDFDNLVMTVNATVDDLMGPGSTYDVLLRGALRTVGDAVYAEVSSGDIFLLNPERKIGSWSGSKE